MKIGRRPYCSESGAHNKGLKRSCDRLHHIKQQNLTPHNILLQRELYSKWRLQLTYGIPESAALLFRMLATVLRSLGQYDRVTMLTSRASESSAEVENFVVAQSNTTHAFRTNRPLAIVRYHFLKVLHVWNRKINE